VADPVYVSENGRWQTIVRDDELLELHDLTANPTLKETMDDVIGELRFTNRPQYVPIGGGQFLAYQSVMRRAVHTLRARRLPARRWQRGSPIP
jgi:hypothetical protein